MVSKNKLLTIVFARLFIGMKLLVLKSIQAACNQLLTCFL